MVSDAGSDLVASEAQGEVRVRKYFQGTPSCVRVRNKTSEDRNDENWGRPIDHNLPRASTIVFARIEILTVDHRSQLQDFRHGIRGNMNGGGKEEVGAEAEQVLQALVDCRLGAGRLAEFGNKNRGCMNFQTRANGRNAWVADKLPVEHCGGCAPVGRSQNGPSDQGPRNAICAPH